MKEKMHIPSESVGGFSFSTEAYLRDFKGNVPLATLGNYLLHAATSHAQQRGFGYEDMVGKHTAWVLSKMAIELYQPLSLAEPLTVLTWIADIQRVTTTRCFEIADPSGTPLGYARSIWAAIDLETRRPVLLDKEKMQPFLSDRPCPIDNPGKIAVAETEEEATGRLKVLYSDLDINGHLNSIKYIEHMLDFFPLTMYQDQFISRFEIAYQAEGKYGMELEVFLTNDTDNHYIASFMNESKAICRCSAQWST